MGSAKLKYFIFDLDGTLYEKKSVVEAYLEEFARIEDYDFKNLHKIFTISYKETKNKQFDSPEAFWDSVHNLFLQKINSNKKFLLDELTEKAKENVLKLIEPRPYLKELITEIKKSGMKIVVFTGSHNMYNSINLKESEADYNKLLEFKKEQIIRLNIAEYVDKLILTSKYGGYKPQKFVFTRLLEELNAKPEECIMIGDQYNDIGAVQLGIYSVLIGNAETKMFNPNLRIKNFNDLRDIIDFQECKLRLLDAKTNL